MADQYDGDAAAADLGDQVPGRAPRSRIQARGELVEEHHLRVPDQGERDEQPLLLAAGQLAEPGVTLARQPPAVQELTPVGGVRVERRVQFQGLADLELVLQLGLLELHADPLVQPVTVGLRVQPEDPDLAGVTPPQALHAFHRGGLARAVRAEDAEDLSPLDVEGDPVHHGLAPVPLGEPCHLDDRRHLVPPLVRLLTSIAWRPRLANRLRGHTSGTGRRPAGGHLAGRHPPFG